MSKYVPDGSFLYCDKGVIPTPFRITEYANVHVTPVPIANDQNNKGLINVIPFGICAAKGGQPCMPATNNMSWSKPAPDVIVGTGIALLDDSTLPCTQGGRIKIAASFMHALAAMYSDPGEMFDRMVDMLKGTGENALAFGKGLLGAGWGLVKFAWDVVKFPFAEGWTALTDFDQFKDNWGSRYDSAKAFGEAALEKGEQLYGLARDPDARAAMWTYMSDPDTWEQAFEGIYETVSEMDNTQIAEFGGQMAFEVLLTVFTGGMGHVSKVDKAGDAFKAAKAFENLDDFSDAGRTLDNMLPDELLGRVDNIDDVPGGETVLGQADETMGRGNNTGAGKAGGDIADDGYRIEAEGVEAGTRNISDADFTQDNIDAVREHLSREEFLEGGEMAANNQEMINRLEAIERGELVPTDTDRAFITHEVREYELMSGGMSYDDAHAMTCKEFGFTAEMERDINTFYTPEANAAYNEQVMKNLGF